MPARRLHGGCCRHRSPPTPRTWPWSSSTGAGWRRTRSPRGPWPAARRIMARAAAAVGIAQLALACSNRRAGEGDQQAYDDAAHGRVLGPGYRREPADYSAVPCRAGVADPRAFVCDACAGHMDAPRRSDSRAHRHPRIIGAPHGRSRPAGTPDPRPRHRRRAGPRRRPDPGRRLEADRGPAPGRASRSTPSPVAAMPWRSRWTCWMPPPSVRPCRRRCARQVAAIEVAWTIDSTNSELLRRRRRAAGRRVLLAERQTGGRGRRGRVWASPLAAHLYLSLARSFGGGLARLGGLSLVAGIAVAEALRGSGLQRGVGLKWPNDVVDREHGGPAQARRAADRRQRRARRAGAGRDRTRAQRADARGRRPRTSTSPGATWPLWPPTRAAAARTQHDRRGACWSALLPALDGLRSPTAWRRSCRATPRSTRWPGSP